MFGQGISKTGSCGAHDCRRDDVVESNGFPSMPGLSGSSGTELLCVIPLADFIETDISLQEFVVREKPFNSFTSQFDIRNNRKGYLKYMNVKYTYVFHTYTHTCIYRSYMCAHV